MKILITGGTGTIATALIKQLKGNDITIFSRNESKQVEVRDEFEVNAIIGDVRDICAINKAVKGMDIVYHLAALKHVDICEQQPNEAIRTNLLGTMNVAEACARYRAKMINMSSDKAANPNNVYSMTKRLTETIATEYGFISMRSGNVVGSSGSFIPNMISRIREKNEVTLTDERMTRFFIKAEDLVEQLINVSAFAPGVYCPQMKSFYIIDIMTMLIKKYGNFKTKLTITGMRPGERLNESINGANEKALSVGALYKIIPGEGEQCHSELYICDPSKYFQL